MYREWWVCTGSGGCVQGVVGVYREWRVCTGSGGCV